VSQVLRLFEAFLRISDMAIAAIMQVTGASTSISLIITHEKYVARTPYIARNSFPRVHL